MGKNNNVDDEIMKLAMREQNGEKEPAPKPKPATPPKAVPFLMKKSQATEPKQPVPIIDPILAQRRRRAQEEREKIKQKNEPPSVDQGPVAKIVDYSMNPSRDKIREVTIIDSMQAKLLPLLDTTWAAFEHCMEIATYRQDKAAFKAIYDKECPEQPDLIPTFIYRTAQWQKSRGGKNLEKIMDIAMAEVETKAEDDGGSSGPANPDY